MNVRSIIRRHFAWLYQPVKARIANIRNMKDAMRLNHLSKDSDAPMRIFYLGITAHSNLGDMAQHYCITKWINENYPNCELVMFESDTVVNGAFLKKFKKIYRPSDVIVFQSGYTTQDLGGNHEYMHRLIVDNMPYANILMMPQTIFFQKEENQKRCADSLDRAQHMLFLARDFVSEEMAKEMFPHQTVKAFPDIVTTLIGTLHFNSERNGVCLCCRNDVEKYYSDEDLRLLSDRIGLIQKITRTDTTINEPYKVIRKHKKQFIEKQIEQFSHFKVVVTDRYHGTIFAIAAGTPVIIIKTTDHKVTTGADWFKGVYDDYVYVAKDLDDAYNKVVEYIKSEPTHLVNPYFKHNYYDKLKGYFEEIINKER